MSRARLRAIAFAAVLAAPLSGCLTRAPQPAPRPSTGTVPITPPPAAETPPPQSVPDAVPRYEPRSQYGNPPFYDVFGKRYFVLSSSADYLERGVASWYGPGFHKVRTSTGETYDMYGMTAAHKTLPLPAYVRVTNLQNGRSIVVRVNDRGPFVGNRIIDLSYTAAAKLDMLRNGTAMVEVRTVEPVSPPGAPVTVVAAVSPAPPPTAAAAPYVSAPTPLAPPPAPIPAPNTPPPALAPVTSAPATALFIQAGAFADPANAERLANRLQVGGYGPVFVRDDVIGGRKMFRVRIGPVSNVPEFDRIVATLERAGVHDAHLALN